ncbi:hypothetical protein [Streptomyces sp. NPDC058657]|uniref:hypothetical protein n=1 Tax=unclassified Streptomyces TaxID=2593676 RepID=UPI00364F2D60
MRRMAATVALLGFLSFSGILTGAPALAVSTPAPAANCTRDGYCNFQDCFDKCAEQGKPFVYCDAQGRCHCDPPPTV